MRRRIGVLGIALVLTIGVAPAHASLLPLDWQAAGDQKVLYDSTTNLEWLDLTESGGLSYTALLAALGSGGQLEGWNLANRNQVWGLWFDATEDARTATDTYVNFFHPGDDATILATWDLVNLMGPSASQGFVDITGVYTNISLIGWHLDMEGTSIGASVDVGQYVSGGPYYAFFRVNNLWSTPPVEAGAWLVRPHQDTPPAVPEPASLLLLGTGLVGLVGAARRRMRK